ncbi:MAG: A24 family peptidase [Gammaproteobacteria bacterium]|nr:A24 family peptidase [Gammaproteobacteria bacterium]
MAFVELLRQSPGLLITLCIGLGLIVGSFLNVVIYRLPIMLQRDWLAQHDVITGINAGTKSDPDPTKVDTFNLALPGSHCPHCQQPLSPLENIPVLSYLFLGGKCSNCQHKISLRYPSVELLTALLSALIASKFGFTWLTPILLLFTWSLIVLTLIDIDYGILPDEITIPLLWAGLLVNATHLGLEISLYDAVFGAIVGYLFLWSFFWIFKLLFGKEGMGFGDFKLLAALGAWMGWQSLLPLIILSSLAGSLFGITMIAFAGSNRETSIPFGPFLAGAGFMLMIWGPSIYDFYFKTLLAIGG